MITPPFAPLKLFSATAHGIPARDLAKVANAIFSALALRLGFIPLR